MSLNETAIALPDLTSAGDNPASADAAVGAPAKGKKKAEEKPPIIAPPAPEPLPDFPKIDKPGRYNLPMSIYHGQPCVGPSVSSSGIRQFANESPAHFFAHWSGNPDRVDNVDTDAFKIGRAAHVLGLGEGEFKKQFVLSPYDEFRSNEAKAWRAAQEAGGLTVLKRAEAEKVSDMASALTSNPLYRAAMREGAGELSYMWQDAATGIWLKARPDWTPLNPQRPLYDYKTTVDASPRAISRSVFEYGYHVQAALALMGVEAVMGEKRPGFAFIFQEKSAPFVSTVAVLDEADVLFGRQIIRKTLDAIARCIEANRWPGYTEEPVLIERPRYLDEQAGELFAAYGAV